MSALELPLPEAHEPPEARVAAVALSIAGATDPSKSVAPP